MRPILLKITAFGPYIDENIIDFTRLKDNNMFLITGPTGAGKTTIFDAIFYALYGQSSGGKRDIKDLRSDFLENEELLTSVEFTFMIKGEDYFIRRIPKQLRKKKRGEGFIEENEKVEFKKLGKDEDVLTKITEANLKIEEIIGIKSEQFRKIVMIPQGDFREFLHSSTSEKEDILRRIFETDHYAFIQRKIKEESDSIEELKSKSEFAVRENLKSIDFMDNEGLKSLVDKNSLISEIIEKFKDFIDEKKKEHIGFVKKLKALKDNVDKLQISYNNGKALNEKFDAKEKAILNLEELEEEKKHIDKITEDIDFSKKAAKVSDLEKSYKNKTMEVDQLEKKIKQLSSKLLHEEKKFETQRKKIKEVPAMKLIIETLDKEVNTLEGYLDDVKSINDKKEAINVLRKKKEEVLKLKMRFDKDIDELEAKEKNKNSKNMEILIKEKENSLLSNKILDNEECLKALRELLKKINEVSKNNKLIDKIIKDVHEREERLKLLNETIKNKRDIHLNSSAITLAKKLVHGEACPVCGSKEHPNPRVTDEEVPSFEEIESLQEDINLLQKDINDLKINLGKLNVSNESLFKTIDEILNRFREKDIFKDILAFERYLKIETGIIIFEDDKEEELKELIKKEGIILKGINDEDKTNVKRVKGHIDNLNKEVLNLKNIEEEIKELKDKRDKSSEDMLAVTSSLAKSEESLKSIITSVPESFQNLKILQSEINDKKDKRRDYINNIDIIEKNYKSKEIEIEKLKSSISSSKEIKKEIDYKLNDLAKNFKEKLDLYFDDYESYRASLIDEEKIKEMEKNIKIYNEKVGSIIIYLNSLNDELKDKNRVNLEVIDEEILNIKEKISNIEAKITEVITSISNNDKIMKFINEKYDDIKDMEKKYRVIGKLSKMANGRSFEKVTFESYVLISYFENVLLKANKRLLIISGGRYYFIRKGDKRGSGKKGLDLDIYDNYTGKAREVKTLSGGESFNASLSLALGLSDEIQHNAGGIELNTIFIDEGFGTLDSEALDNSINVLMELQDNGRLVGIISHVDELKERIPSKLIVKKKKKGSNAYFKVM